MGRGDLYPFTLTAPVERTLDFVHSVVVDAARNRSATPILT